MAPSDSIRAPTRIVVCVLYSFVCSTLDLDLIERSKPAFLEKWDSLDTDFETQACTGRTSSRGTGE